MNVKLIDYNNSDLSVVIAIRVSFSKNSNFVEGKQGTSTMFEEVLSDKDKKLINYLIKHNH